MEKTTSVSMSIKTKHRGVWVEEPTANIPFPSLKQKTDYSGEKLDEKKSSPSGDVFPPCDARLWFAKYYQIVTELTRSPTSPCAKFGAKILCRSAAYTINKISSEYPLGVYRSAAYDMTPDDFQKAIKLATEYFYIDRMRH